MPSNRNSTVTRDRPPRERGERPEGSVPSGANGQLHARVKQELATALADIEARLTEHADDPTQATAALTEALARHARVKARDEDWQAAPLALDFELDPPAPRWIVRRLIERGTVAVLSGDTGAAKSIAADALAVAICLDAAWLDHETYAQRVLVVDEENPERIVRSRLKALGMTNEASERLRYFNRVGFKLGDNAETDARLRAELEEFRPDLVIVDTVMAACELEDVNNNAEAVRILKTVRGLAREFDCAFLLLHHERKRSKEHPASSGQAMMGARQWAGQADVHMTLTVETDLVEDDAETEGHRELRRTFKWRPAEKDRDGRPNIPQRVAVTSEKDAAGRLVWMVVESEGDIRPAESDTEALAIAIAEFVHRADAETTTAEVAKATHRNPQDSTFKRALGAAKDAGYVKSERRGRWIAGVAEPGLAV